MTSNRLKSVEMEKDSRDYDHLWFEMFAAVWVCI